MLNLVNIEDVAKIDLGKAGNSARWLAFWKQQRNAGSADEREEEQTTVWDIHVQEVAGELR